MVGFRPVQSRSKADVLDRFFSWGESTFCPHDAVKDSIPLQEDNLDFVFEHVESLVCREDVTEEKMARGQTVSLQRDNSLIEACNSIQAKIVKRTSASGAKTSQRDGKPIGEKSDILDYCFDQVESYACGEHATGTLVLTEMTPPGGREPINKGASPSPKEEIESEVHLYYRPS
jgi:hypothetical protein